MNVIYINGFAMLHVSLLIREYLLDQKQKCIFLVPQYMVSSLECINMEAIIDFVSSKKFVEYIENTKPNNINIIIHHYETQLNFYPEVLSSVEHIVRNLTVSYFADGYVNTFLHADVAQLNLSKYPQFKAKFLYSFDVALPYYVDTLTYAKHENIRTNYTENIYIRYRFEDLFLPRLENFLSNTKESGGYLLLVMRPWGSESFHGGEYSLKQDAESLYSIVLDMVTLIKNDIGRDFTILYRSDGRDQILMDEFEKLIMIKGIAGLEFLDIKDLIPKPFNLDPFIYFFDKFVSSNIYTAVFDSSSSLSMMPLNLGDRHYIGANNEVVRQECKKPNMLDKLKGKEDITRAHIKRLGSNLNYQEYQVCPGLLCYRKIE